MELLQTVPTWLIVFGLIGGMFLADEIGYRLGKRDAGESEQSRNVSTGLKASIFGLVAFLLGFSFSITSGRHEMRRQVVLDEANAIGTLYLRAGIIGPEQGKPIQNKLRELVDARLDYFAHALDAKRAGTDVQRMNEILNDVWVTVEESAQANESATRTSQIIPAANEVIDLATTRSWAARSHLAPSVLVLLTTSVLVSSFMAGHSSGQSGYRHVGLWLAFNVLFGLVLFVVLDYDRPRQGLVQVDHAPLIELKESIAASAD